MVPVALAQLVGSVKLLPVITGVGFTTTVVFDGKLTQTKAGVV